MKSNLVKNSMLSIVLGGAAVFSAPALAEIGAEGSAAGRGSAAATAAVQNDEQDARASSMNSATVSGNAGARVKDEAIRGSARRNASAVAKAGASAAKNTSADVKQSGGVLRQEASQASRSVSVHGDASGTVNGAANVVETGDGVTIDLNSATDGNAGATIRPLNAERSSAVIKGEAGRLSGNAKGNATALAGTTSSSAHSLASDTRGAISAGAGLTTDARSSTSVQEDISSTVESAVEEGVAQGRAAVDAAVEAAVDVAAEVRSQTDAALEQARNLSADAAGELELTGSGDLDL